jgi:hypothetical protein
MAVMDTQDELLLSQAKRVERESRMLKQMVARHIENREQTVQSEEDTTNDRDRDTQTH